MQSNINTEQIERITNLLMENQNIGYIITKEELEAALKAVAEIINYPSQED